MFMQSSKPVKINLGKTHEKGAQSEIVGIHVTITTAKAIQQMLFLKENQA